MEQGPEFGISAPGFSPSLDRRAEFNVGLSGHCPPRAGEAGAAPQSEQENDSQGRRGPGPQLGRQLGGGDGLGSGQEVVLFADLGSRTPQGLTTLSDVGPCRTPCFQ